MKLVTDIQFLKQVAEFADQQRRLIETEVEGFPINAEATKQRVERNKKDFREFSHTYFPHYIKGNDSLFHEFVYGTVPDLIDQKDGVKEAIAAPRGEAKSTIFSMILVIWVIVTERKWFPIIVMDAFDQAALALEGIKAEFESNPRLQQDYPKVMGKGDTWQVGDIVTNNNRRVQVAGSNKKIRGRKHGPHRPDLVICDDIENDENVKSPKQRNKLESMIKKAVLKLGPPDGSMDIFIIGTVLHYDSVLSRFLKSPAWGSHKFKALPTLPDRMDLWDKFEELFLNEGKDEALRYYHRRKKKMDEGAIVSWPGTRDLVMLMIIRAEDHHSFDSEYQNDPTDSENSPFKDLVYWVHEDKKWLFYGACDPSMGKRNVNRDPAAILIGGINRKIGKLDVVEARIARMVPDLIINTIIELQREYACLLWAIEAVQFQEFMMTELVKRSATARCPVPARGIVPHIDKELRIQSLQPHTANGLIRFHHSHRQLLEQMQHWPEADHDDGPDALQMLWQLAVGGAGQVPNIQSRGSGPSQERMLNGY